MPIIVSDTPPITVPTPGISFNKLDNVNPTPKLAIGAAMLLRKTLPKVLGSIRMPLPATFHKLNSERIMTTWMLVMTMPSTIGIGIQAAPKQF